MQYNLPLKAPKQYLIRELAHNTNRVVDAEARDCFGCHSSGPVRLRPRKWDGLPDLTDEGWSLIKTFNQKILTYGSVLTVWPSGQPSLSDSELQSVQVEGCSGCHQSDSIRSPLLRFHAKGIVALMNAHEQKNGYYDYSMPNPDALFMLISGNFKTEKPSISRYLLPAMPPLGPMTEQENRELFNWLGVGAKK